MSKIEMKCEELLAVLRALVKFASKDEHHPHLAQIAIRGPRWMATNGHALVWIHMGAAIDGETAIPLSTASALISILRSREVKRGVATIDTGFREVAIEPIGLRLSWKVPADAFPPAHKIAKKTLNPVAHIGVSTEYTRLASELLSDLGFSAMHVELSSEQDPILLTGTQGGGGGTRGKRFAMVERASVVIMPVRVSPVDKELGDALTVSTWVAECEAAEAAAEADIKAAEEAQKNAPEAAE